MLDHNYPLFTQGIHTVHNLTDIGNEIFSFLTHTPPVVFTEHELT